MKRLVNGIDIRFELAAGASSRDGLAFAAVPVGRVGKGAVAYRVCACAAAAALLSLVACGDGDVTRLHPEQTLESPIEPAPAEESRTFAVLSERVSLDAVCRLIGVSSAGAGASCDDVVERCRVNVDALLGPEGEPAPAVGVPAGSLEPLLGCPLSFNELDGCVAQVLERSVAMYGSQVSCDMPALPEVDTLRLLASPECLTVALLCPELIGSAGAPSTIF